MGHYQPGTKIITKKAANLLYKIARLKNNYYADLEIKSILLLVLWFLQLAFRKLRAFLNQRELGITLCHF